MELIKQKLELDLFKELKEELVDVEIDINEEELKSMIKKEVEMYEFNFHKRIRINTAQKKDQRIVVKLDYGTLIMKKDAPIKKK